MSSTCPVRWSGPNAIITLPAEIDIANVRQADHEISILMNSRPAILVLDMTATRFCDSSCIAAILRARKRATALGISLRLAAVTAPVARLLHITGADKIIAAYPTPDAALTSETPTQPPPGSEPPQ